MEGEVAKRNLYEAATTGKVARFIQLLEQDPYLVDVTSFSCSRNILHMATMHRQVRIVEEITRRHPQLAQELDSQKSSPLHIAAAKGYDSIVAMLLRIAPEMRWSLDGQGMNPVHVAAMKGHESVLMELLQLDSLPAMERLHRGQTVLHLCVKHCQIGTLNALAGKLGELVCAKDDDGETILHLAVRCDQLEIIKYLVESNIIEKQTLNSMGKTALQILKESPTHTTNYSEIEKILLHLLNKSTLKSRALPKLTDMTMVVVVLIATINQTQTPKADASNINFKTLGSCKLGIPRYPDFNYNATGGAGSGTATKLSDRQVSVEFHITQLYIPPLSVATTTFLGLPLPPFLKIDIVPEAFRGTIDRETGKVIDELRL